MTQVITVRIPDRDAAALDELVRMGRFTDRSSAVREAITDLLMADVYARAYGAQPQTAEELEGLQEELRDAVTEEPW
jgi:Arc/MetJ-type ribon-helix-helix transcriptional regulator